MRTGVVVVVVALGVALLAARWYTSDARAADQAHDRALALWKSKEPATYSFDWAYCSGMCAGCSLRVTVHDAVVTQAVPKEERCQGSGFDNGPTVEDVFAMEQRDRSAEYTDSFDIAYDPTWGFPASVEIRCPDGYSDCGTGYAITHFLVG